MVGGNLVQDRHFPEAFFPCLCLELRSVESVGLGLTFLLRAIIQHAFSCPTGFMPVPLPSLH